MPIQSQTDFCLDLCQEHIEEASFLYEQRLGLLDDPEITWLDVGDFEERLEAHLDALVVHEENGLQLCQEQAAGGDFGELYAAVQVFCRQERWDLFLPVLEQTDITDKDRLQAITDALLQQLPKSWEVKLFELWDKKHKHVHLILPKIIGYKRLKAEDMLLKALQEQPEPSIAWALGRLRAQQARLQLFNYLYYAKEDATRQTIALALLRLGESQTLNYCQEQAKTGSWASLPLGLAGSRSALNTLTQITQQKLTSETLLAMGFLGEPSAVELLLPQLNTKDLAPAAAQALNLITGAEIYGEVFIPEEIDEDELFEEELEKKQKGEPLYSPGEEPGTTITCLSQDPQEWLAWWDANKNRFDPQQRYRNGKLFSPECLLENLRSEKSPRRVRQLAYEELVIRYGIDAAFETEYLVSEQKLALSDLQNKIKTAGPFTPGKWYFAGQLAAR